MLCNVNKLRLLPLLTFIWLFLTFIVSYSIAVSMDHVYPVWPYISDTGTLPPESCWFGIMLNIGSLLMLMVFCCQYVQIALKMAVNKRRSVLCKWLNVLCLVAGAVAALGACVVANFQETSDIKMHLFGANLIFGVGAGYFVLQTILCSILNNGDTTGYKLNVFRSVLCVLHITTFVTTLVYARKSLAEFSGGTKAALQFNPDHKNYEFRLASTFSEWTLAVCLGFYLLTFFHDFKHLSLSLSFRDRRVTTLAVA